MPGDERQMPARGGGMSGPTTAVDAESTGHSSCEWGFGSVLAVLAVLSVG